jgi:hypothetical protein
MSKLRSWEELNGNLVAHNRHLELLEQANALVANQRLYGEPKKLRILLFCTRSFGEAITLSSWTRKSDSVFVANGGRSPV